MLGAAKIAPLAIIEPASRRTDCKVVAVASRDPGRANAFADANGIADVAQSYEDLVARDDLDLIYNALPPHRHADLSITALQAGKPVLCEKPFAMNANDASRMLQAADAAGLPLIEAFHYRYHPAFMRALQIAQDGQLGALEKITAAFDVAIPYKKGELRHTLSVGGGALMDLGCYPLHWARTLIGEEPRITDAQAKCLHEGVDVSMQADLAFPGGASGSISCSMAEGVERRAYLKLEGALGTLLMLNPIAPHLGHEIQVTINGETETEIVSGNTTYDHQLDHVIRVINDGDAPLTGGDDALANMKAIDAIYRKAGLSPRGM